MKKGLLIKNGRIYTMDERNTIADSCAIMDGRIVAVGENIDIKDKKFEVIDLKGKTVLPGFIDCHVHFLGFSLGLDRIDLSEARSLDDALKAVREKVFKQKSRVTDWILGWGWNKNEWGDGKFPNKDELDSISRDFPISLSARDGHALWCNSLALKIAGINRDTPDPKGGKIERDEKGEPTGILLEEARRLIHKVVAEPTKEEKKRAILNGIKKAHSFGITSVHDCSSSKIYAPFELISELKNEGKLSLRFCLAIPMDSLKSAIEDGIRSGDGDEWIKWGGVKILADGSLSSQTAFMFEPYLGDKKNTGILTLTIDELNETVLNAGKAGISSWIHAIGDRTNHLALNAIEQSKTFLRHRIEHAQCLVHEDISRFKRLGVIASMQPVHIPLDIDIAEKHWGERGKNAFLFRSLIHSNVKVCFGSDAPVESLNPVYGIWAAVNRKRWDGTPEGGWYPLEKISVLEAVYGWTRNAGYSSYEESLKGTLEIGKLGDLVVLSEDIFEVEKDRIKDLKVEMTIIGGEIQYGGW